MSKRAAPPSIKKAALPQKKQKSDKDLAEWERELTSEERKEFLDLGWPLDEKEYLVSTALSENNKGKEFLKLQGFGFRCWMDKPKEYQAWQEKPKKPKTLDEDDISVKLNLILAKVATMEEKLKIIEHLCTC